MIKKYIRGNELRGYEVIKELEKLGGVKEPDIIYETFSNSYYIVDTCDKNYIKAITNEFLKELIEQTFEEIHLPEVFTPEEFVIVTEKAISGCCCCVFKKGMYCTAGMWLANDCIKKGIIYKLKQ